MRERAITILMVLGLVAWAGCGGDDDGGSDAATELDGGGAERDARVPREDAGEPEEDAGSSEPDAGAPEPCETPGATETVACGDCGTTTRFCTAGGTWAYGTCEDEGECAPGDERSGGACGNCGTQTERCSDACAWEPSGACSGEGVCAPGTRTRSGEGCAAGETRELLCGDACTFSPAGACEADACDTPGTTERVACGMCGTRERFCTAARVWSYGLCEGEGVCMPGTSQAVPCGMCGTRMARCTTACAWDASGTCTGEGTCSPGETSRTSAGCPSGQSRALTCNDACTFDAGACEVDECMPGETTTVACGMCGTRTRTCSAMRRWQDGPCTGEGVCMPGTTGTQSCGFCGTQTTLCDTTCAWVASGACSGGGTCAAGTTGSCTTSCGSTGTQTCSASCAPGACVPPGESCNGSDDDCDSTVDEGCSGCTPCAGSTAITGTGGRYTVTLGAGSRTGSCGGAGSEALLTVTVTEPSDVFVSTHGAGFDTVVYARRCTCSGTEVACNDDADGRLTSALRLTNVPAGTYAIVVDSEVAMSRTVQVDAYVTPTATQGDRCGNPRVIAPGATRITGNTCSFANDYDTPTAASGAGCFAAAAGEGPEAVYYFQLTTTSTVGFDGCNEGFSYDGTVYVRSVCNSAVAADERVCDDDACSAGTGTCTSLGFGPRTSVSLPPGLYYLFVDGYRSSSGSSCAGCGPFDLSITGI